MNEIYRFAIHHKTKMSTYHKAKLVVHAFLGVWGRDLVSRESKDTKRLQRGEEEGIEGLILKAKDSRQTDRQTDRQRHRDVVDIIT
jgi:hypothetical protein